MKILQYRWFGQAWVLAVLCAVAVFVMGSSSLAAPSDGSVSERRSCIQSVDGYSYIAEDKTISELRDAALSNAKQQALKNAKTYIRSRTEVENFVLKSDEVLINAEGTVTILEMEDKGIQDNSRYHIWVKAEVEYVLGEGTGGQARTQNAATEAAAVEESGGEPASVIPAAQSFSPQGPLTVQVWSSKQQYRAGEQIEVFIRGNRDFYARIVDITSSGDIVQLLPNEYRGSTMFRQGEVYKIPDTGDQFDLTVGPPYGKDTIVVYASEVPLGQVAMDKIGQGLMAYGGDRKTLGFTTRGISVTAKKQKAQQQPQPQIAEFYEAEYQITTAP